LTFEIESQLAQIDDLCFIDCSSNSIYISCSIQFIKLSYFLNIKIKASVFETKSQLTQIGDSYFVGCPLVLIFIPHFVKKIEKIMVFQILKLKDYI